MNFHLMYAQTYTTKKIPLYFFLFGKSLKMEKKDKALHK